MTRVRNFTSFHLAKGVALDIPDTRRWLGEGMSEALG